MKKNKKLSQKSVWDLHVENFLTPVWEDHVGWIDLIDGTFMESWGEKPSPSETTSQENKTKRKKRGEDKDIVDVQLIDEVL